MRKTWEGVGAGLAVALWDGAGPGSSTTDGRVAALLCAVTLGIVIALSHSWPLPAWLVSCAAYPVANSLIPPGENTLTLVLPPILGTFIAALSEPVAVRRQLHLLWIGLAGAAATGIILLHGADLIGDQNTYASALSTPAPMIAAVKIDQSEVLLGAMLLIGAVLAGDWVRHQRLATAAVEQRNRDLIRLRHAHQQHAINAERTFIARELHDIVAHHITAVVVRAQAAHHVARTQPHEASAAVRWIAHTGQEALTAMRQVVSVLHTSAHHQRPPGHDIRITGTTITALINRVRDAGLPVTLHAPSTWSVSTTPHAGLATVRIIQEALTNTLMHSDATHALVRIYDQPHALRIHIDDNGTTPPHATPADHSRPHHGLLGMHERARTLGGTLTITHSPLGGWALTATLPHQQDEPAGANSGY